MATSIDTIAALFQRTIDYWIPERISQSVPFECAFKSEAWVYPETKIDTISTGQPGTIFLKEAELVPKYGKPDAISSEPSTSIDPFETKTMMQEIVAIAETPPSFDPLQKKLDSTPEYNSIGKIYTSAGINGSTENYDVYVTAFYIGQPTTRGGDDARKVLTVAHAFDDNRFHSDYHIFVPASNANLSNRNEVYLILPGDKGRFIHPDYTKGSRRHDICVMYIHPIPFRGRKVDETLVPLSLIVTKRDYTTNDHWKIIGYPSLSRKYVAIEGSYVSARMTDHYIGRTVQINTERRVEYGMSGGPWILIGSSNQVNGIQSGLMSTSFNAISPDFTKELLDILGLDFTLHD